jgi:hypothetical protein
VIPSWLLTRHGAAVIVTVTLLGGVFAWGRLENAQRHAMVDWAEKTCAAAGVDFETRAGFPPFIGGRLPAQKGACFTRVVALRKFETDQAIAVAQLEKANTDALIAELESRSAKGDTDAAIYADAADRFGDAAQRLAAIESKLEETDDVPPPAQPGATACPAPLPADYWSALAELGGLRVEPEAR